jgi:hypothetical protein
MRNTAAARSTAVLLAAMASFASVAVAAEAHTGPALHSAAQGTAAHALPSPAEAGTTATRDEWYWGVLPGPGEEVVCSVSPAGVVIGVDCGGGGNSAV